ncbi:hypothetical protein [Thermoplasma volcanium GSS1]|uniref:Ribbon-helix-helix protein CopG domain-containing protein n=1 Tax=Thermoplasma volcanium (strain ATCC 51530 / DSM 4299 / JCM 9571 / NBRC 15438 / GSS1) TaxID=273116 RepID=Q97B54_THEVO|nr:type II toxin-antitoxin system ParD family antitoxin [Thermoplasma volcanium]BAB59746.1 hypothetical protein [Thermoplasma volcanium GSS1]
MVEEKRITVRLPLSLVDEIQNLVDTGEFESMSDVVRRALVYLTESRTAKKEYVKVDLLIPKKIVSDSDGKIGTSITLDDLASLVLDRMNSRVARDAIKKIVNEENIK